METTEDKRAGETAEDKQAAESTQSTQATETTETAESSQATESAQASESAQALEEPLLPRKDIALRFLFTLVFVVAFEIFKAVLWIIVLFQYIYLFITRSYSDTLRNFCNKLSVYAYEVFRYLSLNENDRPFPFSGFPEETEPPEDEVLFP